MGRVCGVIGRGQNDKGVKVRRRELDGYYYLHCLLIGQADRVIATCGRKGGIKESLETPKKRNVCREKRLARKCKAEK
jgi:hypothetical protein